MTDSHAHLTLEPISLNALDAVKRFKDEGGKHILHASYSVESLDESIRMIREIERVYPNTIYLALGLHPEEFSYEADGYEKYKKYMDRFENVFKDNKDRVVAIGETGLDYYHIKRTDGLEMEKVGEIIEVQKNAFRRHLELAKEHNLPLTIHTRDLENESICIEEALELVAQVGQGCLKGSFHSYTGDKKHLNEILDLGFHVGINGIVTYPSADNVRDLVKDIPLDRILLETDCPLLPPQNVRKDKKRKIRYGQPSDVREIGEVVAEIKGVKYQKLEEQTDRNFELLFLPN